MLIGPQTSRHFQASDKFCMRRERNLICICENAVDAEPYADPALFRIYMYIGGAAGMCVAHHRIH